jgi:hypothetical protein
MLVCCRRRRRSETTTLSCEQDSGHHQEADEAANMSVKLEKIAEQTARAREAAVIGMRRTISQCWEQQHYVGCSPIVGCVIQICPGRRIAQ